MFSADGALQFGTAGHKGHAVIAQQVELVSETLIAEPEAMLPKNTALMDQHGTLILSSQ